MPRQGVGIWTIFWVVATPVPDIVYPIPCHLCLLLLSPVSASTVDVKLNVVCHSVVTLLIESFSSQIIGQCPCFEVVSSLKFSKQVEHEALCNGARKCVGASELVGKVENKIFSNALWAELLTKAKMLFVFDLSNIGTHIWRTPGNIEICLCILSPLLDVVSLKCNCAGCHFNLTKLGRSYQEEYKRRNYKSGNCTMSVIFSYV